jgi:hypothetical protein
MAITHDGKFAYGTSYGNGTGNEDSITAFKLLPDGQLQQLAGTAGCFTEDGTEDGTAGACTAGRTIGSGDGTSIVISSDDRFLYAVSQGDNSTASGVAIFRRNKTTGALTQLSGTAGCINPVGAVEAGCASGYILTAADGLIMSPDGKFLYVGTYSQSHSGMSVFRRNSSTGTLTQLSGTAGCLSDDGLSEQAGHLCTKLNGMKAGSYAEDPVIPPDGKNLYFSSWDNTPDTQSAEIALARNPTTGVLTQLPGIEGCTTSDGTAAGGGTCATARGLDGDYEEAMSPDGKNVYVAAWTAQTIVVFKRLSDGSLIQLSGKPGCVSPDGSSQTGAGTCQVGRALSNMQTPVVSPDGRSFYTAEYGPVGGISAFSRNPSTGALTQLPGLEGCFTTDGSSQDGANTCTVGRALGKNYDVTVSPDGGNVYAAGNDSSTGGFAVFSRQASPLCASQTVTLSQARAVTLSLSCMDPNSNSFHRSIVTKPAHGRLSAIGPTGKV